ncbi:MAG TPA: hypothetical protein PLK90_02690 [Clostridiales bacterium]|nr:hypothetical protein [Clostridiales bacterium]HQP69285.1 hypothetical protein [Clostridiales bacterium]
MKKKYTFESVTGMSYEKYLELENKYHEESTRKYEEFMEKDIAHKKVLLNSLYRKKCYLMKKYKAYIEEYPVFSIVINESYNHVKAEIEADGVTYVVFTSVYFFTYYVSDDIKIRFMSKKKREGI